MYEEIMRNSRDSFFILLNVIRPEDSREDKNNFWKSLRKEGYDIGLDMTEENEWMQEYQIIYNSYILDSTEIKKRD